MTGDARRIVRSAGACGAIAILMAATAAAAVAWSGHSQEVRRILRFDFAGVRRSPSELVEVALHNGRLAAGALVLALVMRTLGPRTRRAATVLLAALLVVNAAAIGVAVGAYGLRLLAAIAPHLPLELGGLCLAGGSCMEARRDPLRPRALAVVAGGCAASVVAAAALETYLSPGWPR